MPFISRVQTYVFRYPLENPVVTSFGAMHDRPAVLVRVENSDGAHGWGEIWCNFPGCGAEHRARLVDTAIAPRLLGRDAAEVAALFAELERDLRLLGLQTGEPGPLAQAIAGVDIALWDLAARAARVPVRKMFNPEAAHSVAAYASGIHPRDLDDAIDDARANGYRAFKLKVGFDPENDRTAVARLRRSMRSGERLMLDANQAWDLKQAAEIIPQLAEFRPDWLEEPLSADRPWDEWRLLAKLGIPLAAGENLRGARDFEAAMDNAMLCVVQPDMCKWGGFSGCFAIAREVVRRGLIYCPHFLGAGIGLMASAQLLAAIGGSGMLEVDSNPNPLRQLLAQPPLEANAGLVALSDAPGLGVEPDLDGAANFLTFSSVAQ